MTRRLGITAVALLLTAGNQVAGADPGHGQQPVTWSTVSVETVGGDFACDPTDPTRCAGSFRLVRTLSGDLTGTSYVAGTAVPLSNGTYQGQAVVQFTGDVAGCGSGTLLMLEEGILDPVTGASEGTWTIVEGQGTGDLALTTGSGTEAGGAVRCS